VHTSYSITRSPVLAPPDPEMDAWVAKSVKIYDQYQHSIERDRVTDAKIQRIVRVSDSIDWSTGLAIAAILIACVYLTALKETGSFLGVVNKVLGQ
jgi:hypothetical protein